MSSSSTRRKSLQNGVEILVRGTVQGVGFRPFVFKLASRCDIAGSVTNTGDGVLIKATGAAADLSSFIDAISTEAPPLARITDITVEPLEAPLTADSFTIEASRSSASALATIPPDIALCDDCLRELTDPGDHRYRYPFINCTNCGPRFSIIETIPYDRPQTSMKSFAMCPVCNREYIDPLDRRFHAQPNACPACGPTITWHDAAGAPIHCADVVKEAIAAIGAGKVVAIRGLGGFHLCVDACSETAVATLRRRKNRPAKPLAIMVADLAAAERLCVISETERQTLTAPQHPIVLLHPKPDTPLAPNLAPAMSDIGLMLPYTPLHHLLFAEPDCPPALVMTSGNSSGEPICTANEDGLARLAGIADNFLLHDRDIVTRVDDSVVKETAGAIRSLRRARGYAPEPIEVAYDLPEIIGCGGGLKSTFSLARGRTIYPSQHIGDLFNLASYEFFTESVENLKRLYEIEPAVAACDLHPDYLSTHYARELGLPLYRVQHHHAHAVAVMAEHGLTTPVLALILDGTGYGPDNTVWGGELLEVGLTSFTRLGRLQHLALPGGDAAAEQPWRMALALLHRLLGPAAAESRLLDGIDRASRTTVVQMIERGFNTPLTSSCGRLFDGMAALLGLNLVSSFEGQAAMQLESCARKTLTTDWKDIHLEGGSGTDDYLHVNDDNLWEVDSNRFIETELENISSGAERPATALRFHCWLIDCLSRLVENLAASTGIDTVVLSGGCMQNSILLEGLLYRLERAGLRSYTGARLPINDGGISIGQAVIGGLRHVSRRTDES